MRIKLLRILFMAAFVSACALIGNAQDAAKAPEADPASATANDAAGQPATTASAAEASAAAPVTNSTAPASAAPAAAPVLLTPKRIQANVTAYMSVNENHELLKSLEGRWMTTVSYWMDPSADAQVSEGISESKMIMNGKFLEQTFSGTSMGQPYEGRGITGYDNLKKEFTSVWFDNMATGIMTSGGQYNPETKVIAFEGSMSCPVTQEAHRWVREALTIKDSDNYTFESFMKDKAGKEYKAMEIIYKRLK